MGDEQSLHDSLTDTHRPANKTAPSTQSPFQQTPPLQPQEQAQCDLQQPASQSRSQERRHSQIQSSNQAQDKFQQQQYYQQHDPSEGQPSVLPGNQPPITAEEQADAFEQAENGVQVWHQSEDEFDDGYATDGSAASTSLASSAREYIFENGRRYHSYRAGLYNFPNDEREQDREDLKHAMYLKLFNKTLHFAPIPTTGAIDAIDLGTGTGIWALDFADLYPDSNVLGIDLSPIQTTWVPPNLKFMVDDAESAWLHPPNHFDYVHTRHMVQAIKDWPRLYERAFQHIKPGGWMESQEIDHLPRADDGTLPTSNALFQYWEMIMQALDNMGVTFRFAPRLADAMRDAGFINVTERVFYTPIGPWPKNRQLRETGLYWRAVLMEGLEAIAIGPLTRGLGWSREEVMVFLADVRKTYLDRDVHSYMPFHVVYGQKPYA